MLDAVCVLFVELGVVYMTCKHTHSTSTDHSYYAGAGAAVVHGTEKHIITYVGTMGIPS